jgi:hypothetical protein
MIHIPSCEIVVVANFAPMVEYSSPNTNKRTLGHANSYLGYSVPNYSGTKCIKQIIMIEIHLSMLAWQKFGGNSESTGLKRR